MQAPVSQSVSQRWEQKDASKHAYQRDIRLIDVPGERGQGVGDVWGPSTGPRVALDGTRPSVCEQVLKAAVESHLHGLTRAGGGERREKKVKQGLTWRPGKQGAAWRGAGS
jgi:hypothetical protein